jgi:hypothetical protein
MFWFAIAGHECQKTNVEEVKVTSLMYIIRRNEVASKTAYRFAERSKWGGVLRFASKNVYRAHLLLHNGRGVEKNTGNENNNSSM